MGTTLKVDDSYKYKHIQNNNFQFLSFIIICIVLNIRNGIDTQAHNSLECFYKIFSEE